MSLPVEAVIALIDAAGSANLRELIVAQEGLRVEIRARREAEPDLPAAPRPAAAPEPQDLPQPGPKGTDVTAPMAGIVHLTPGPDQPRFVELGRRVAEGDTLCIVEAMKVFTPILSDRAGVIMALHVESGAEVFPGQVLLTLGPE